MSSILSSLSYVLPVTFALPIETYCELRQISKPCSTKTYSTELKIKDLKRQLKVATNSAMVGALGFAYIVAIPALLHPITLAVSATAALVFSPFAIQYFKQSKNVLAIMQTSFHIIGLASLIAAIAAASLPTGVLLGLMGANHFGIAVIALSNAASLPVRVMLGLMGLGTALGAGVMTSLTQQTYRSFIKFESQYIY